MLPPPTWRAIEAVPVFLLSIVGVVLLSIPVLAVKSCAGRFTLGALAGELGLGGAVLVWVRLVSKAPLAALGRPREPLKDLGIGAGIGVAMVFLGGLVVWVVDTIVTSVAGHQVSQPVQVDACVRGPWLLASGAVVILAAPVCEELFFRGFLFRGMRRRFSTAPAVIISGVVFGLIHYQDLSFLIVIPALAVIGMTLAVLFENRQSLLATIAAHAAFNAIGFAMIALNR